MAGTKPRTTPAARRLAGAASTPTDSEVDRPEPDLSVYQVACTLDHDGLTYSEGEHVELSAAEAAPLLAARIVTQPDA